MALYNNNNKNRIAKSNQHYWPAARSLEHTHTHIIKKRALSRKQPCRAPSKSARNTQREGPRFEIEKNKSPRKHDRLIMQIKQMIHRLERQRRRGRRGDARQTVKINF